MPNNDDFYGTYDPSSPVYRPTSERLTVEAGVGSKGRAKKNATATMTAPPEFIKRFKPTKVGRKVDHVDGIVEDSASDYSEQFGESFNAIDRHLIHMADDEDLAEMIYDNIDYL